MARRCVSTGAPRKNMTRLSYLRARPVGVGKGIPALRPPRTLIWGLRHPAAESRDPPKDRPVPSDRSARQPRPATRSSRPEITLRSEDPKSAPTRAHSANPSRSESPPVPPPAPVNRLTPPVQDSPDRRRSGMPAASETPVDSQSTLVLAASSDQSAAGRLVPADAQPSDPDPLPREVMPRPAQLRSPIAERLDGSKTPGKVSRESPVVHEALPDIPRSSVATTQASTNIKPAGNAVHIGSVEIHVHPAPALVPRSVARQRVAVVPITRGFGAPFGLTQG
jgi:hypothetical protein